MDELERVTGTADFQIENWTVLMVKPGYIGPFVATAKVLGEKGSRVGVEATLTDQGNRDRTIASASAAFRRVDR
jgi:acyl-coenzyme A thioesterase PaaI-like protein